MLTRIGRMLGKRDDETVEEVRPESADRRVLFVCMGNICRSPTAEGVFRHKLKLLAPELRIYVDSAGTHAYHVGEPPDPRACRAAERRGIDIVRLRARRVTDEDFNRFDLILAMDALNRATLEERCAPEQHGRIRLLLDFSSQYPGLDVPDPYYGGVGGFERVLDMVEDAAGGLIDHLRAHAGARD